VVVISMEHCPPIVLTALSVVMPPWLTVRRRPLTMSMGSSVAWSIVLARQAGDESMCFVKATGFPSTDPTTHLSAHSRLSMWCW
jgi:hypothetical protein